MNKQESLIAVQQYGYALQYASEQLKSDKEVVLAAVQQNRNSFPFASKELINKIGNNNPIIVLEDLIQIEQDKVNLEQKIKIQHIKNNSNKVVKL